MDRRTLLKHAGMMTAGKNFNANSWEVYGTGAFLLAGSEVIKLKQ
jgi:hypothetical protein